MVALGIATPEERKNWFARYENQIESGKINFFDRSWYNRGIVEPVMGYGTEEEYFDFMNNVNKFEQSLVDKGMKLFKFWLPKFLTLAIKVFGVFDTGIKKPPFFSLLFQLTPPSVTAYVTTGG